MPTNSDSDSEEAAGKKRANSEVMESTLDQGRQIKSARSGSPDAVMAEGSSAGKSRDLDSEDSNSAASDLSIRSTFSSRTIRPSGSEVAAAVLTDAFSVLPKVTQQIGEGVVTSSLTAVQSGELGGLKELAAQSSAIKSRMKGTPIDLYSDRNEPDPKMECSKVLYEAGKGLASAVAQGGVTAAVAAALNPVAAIFLGAGAGAAVGNALDVLTNSKTVTQTARVNGRERMSQGPFPLAGELEENTHAERVRQEAHSPKQDIFKQRGGEIT